MPLMSNVMPFDVNTHATPELSAELAKRIRLVSRDNGNLLRPSSDNQMN